MARGTFAIVLFVVATIYFGMVTHFSGRLFEAESLGEVYDAIGTSLVASHTTELPIDVIKFEAFQVRGRNYTYFGPFPALPRIFLNAVFPSLYGRWSRLMCLMAALLCVGAFGAIIRVVAGRSASNLTYCFLTLAFALASPVFFLVSCAYVYSEAALWGLAGAMFFIFFFFKLLKEEQGRERRWIFSLACSMAVALLSRPTCGVAVYLGAFGLLLVSKLRPTLRQPRFFLLFAPALAAILFQMWVNYDRFGNVAVFADYHLNLQKDLSLSQGRALFFDTYGTFNLGRLPTAFFRYFWGEGSRHFLSQLPFIRYIWPEQVPLFNQIDPTMPLSFLSPWLMVLAVCGAFAGGRRSERSVLAVDVLVLAFGVQALLILTYFAVCQRYEADFLPLFAVLAALGCAKLRSRAVLAAVGFGIAAGIAVTVLSTFHWLAYIANSHLAGSIPEDFTRVLLSRLHQ